MDVQIIPSAIIVKEIFDHTRNDIPPDQKSEVCALFRKQIAAKWASNETSYVSVVWVYKEIKDQIDEETTLCFLRFLKAAIMALPSREKELVEHGFDLDKIRPLEPLSAPQSPSDSKRKISIRRKSLSNASLALYSERSHTDQAGLSSSRSVSDFSPETVPNLRFPSSKTLSDFSPENTQPNLGITSSKTVTDFSLGT